MKLGTGKKGTAGAGMPSLYTSRIRTYGAGGFEMGDQEDVTGCPRQYKAKYEERRVHDLGGDSPRAFGSVIHDALFVMERDAIGPEDALLLVWPPDLPVDRWREAVDLLDDYMARGGSMADFSTLHVETELSALLYVDEDFGPIYFGGIIDRIGVEMDLEMLVHVVDYKGLDLTTPIPTPAGWTTMGELEQGDLVLGGDGRPCRVVVKSEIHNRRCFRLRFEDNSAVICDDEHRWEVLIRQETNPRVVTALELAGLRANGAHVRVLNAAPLDLPDADLPIDPYVLGCWLGDGSASSGLITPGEKPIFDEIRRRGYRVGEVVASANGSTVFGLITQLRELGVLDNKHVPQMYLRASMAQRLDLLRGLMDTDGHWNPIRRRCVMNTTAPWQAEAVRELVVSLGWKCTIFDTIATGFGRKVPAKQAWFTPVGVSPFLVRTPKTFTPAASARSTRRLLKSIEEIDSVPTQCIEVDSPDHLYLATEHMIPTHNTNQAPPSREAVAKDVQLMGYSWLVLQNLELLGLRPGSRIVAHLDAVRWKDIAWQFERFELDEWRDWAEAIARRILRDDEGEPVLNPGCNWCPVKLDCPAYLALPGSGDSLLERFTTTSAEEMWRWRQEAAELMKKLKAGVDEVDATLKQKATTGAFQIGDQVWSMEDSWSNVLDKQQLIGVIGQGRFIELAEISKTKLDGYARSKGPEMKLAIKNCWSRVVTGRGPARKTVRDDEEGAF